MLALIDLDGDADLPQNLLVNLADRRAQRPNRGRGIEIENRHEVLMLEILFRIQPTARHQGIGDTDGGGGLKLDFDVVIIVLRQERTVNDIAEISLMIVPILTRQLLQYIWTGKPGSQSGFPSISCLSYNERSNWLTITSLGFYVRRKDCQSSSCCSVRFEQVEPPDAGEFASHNRLNRQREKMDSGCRFLVLEECK